MNNKAPEIQAVKFTPVVSKAGPYKVYAYFPKVKNASTLTHIEVFNGKQRKNIAINKSDIQVVGQTSGEWAALVTYNLARGNKAYVEISNKNADGIVVADAVLFVPQH